MVITIITDVAPVVVFSCFMGEFVIMQEYQNNRERHGETTHKNTVKYG
jgi:hypothetical protein